MDLQVNGSRPPSARTTSRRPLSRINPITGEELYTTTTPRAQSRVGSQPISTKPEGVPSLNLDDVIGADDKGGPPPEVSNYKYEIRTPGTASTISWGTPCSTYQQQTQESQRSGRNCVGNGHNFQSSRQVNQKKSSAWDQPVIPENLPPPSERYRQQYQQCQEDMRNSYRAHVNQGKITHGMNELKLDLNKGFDQEAEDDDSKVEVQKAWTTQPYSKAQALKKVDREELEAEKKKLKLIETVMIDQLARPVVCDPEQDEALASRQPKPYTPIKKGALRRLHDTKVRTAGSATENLLSKRVRFGGRILTREGRDAIRELTGFFFSVDNSLTIYEYRQFGKSHKALPFINRGCYKHVGSRLQGKPFTLVDIQQGNTLVFECQGQSLPDSIMKHDRVKVRITEVDQDARQTLLLEGVPIRDRQEVWERLHMPQSEEDRRAWQLQKEAQEHVLKQVKKRSVRLRTGLGHMFKKLDDANDGCLNKYELEKSLVDYHIDIPTEMFDDLWEVLDYEGTSFLDYDEFLRGFIGEMNEDRKALVRKAFQKIDSGRKGVVTVSDMRKFYNAHRHPRTKSGESTIEEVLQEFMSIFLEGKSHGNEDVSYAEFEEYYEGLSLGVDNDADFASILQNAWSV